MGGGGGGGVGGGGGRHIDAFTFVFKRIVGGVLGGGGGGLEGGGPNLVVCVCCSRLIVNVLSLIDADDLFSLTATNLSSSSKLM